MSTQPITAPLAVTADADDDMLPESFALDIRSVLALLPDDDALDAWFIEFTHDNKDLGYQFEIDEAGRLLAMASESMDGMQRAGSVYFDLQFWANTGPAGLVVTGNALVRMPWPGRRAPDAGWIAPEQLAELPPAGQRDYGVPFAPRFIVEIRSRSNALEDQQAKMEEWITSGALLGWLIDPFQRRVHIYRPGAEPEVLHDPETINGEPVLPGFVFNVRNRIFNLH